MQTGSHYVPFQGECLNMSYRPLILMSFLKFFLKALCAEAHKDPFYMPARGHQPPSASELGNTGQHLQSEATETPSQHTI